MYDWSIYIILIYYFALFFFSQVSGSIKAIFSSKPGELIVHTSNEEKAMMIVVGCRGLGKVRRTILGSVSDYVLHHATCPVFICRKG